MSEDTVRKSPDRMSLLTEREQEALEGKLWETTNRAHSAISFRCANGELYIFSYDDYRGARVAKETLKVYFSTGTVTIWGRKLSQIAERIGSFRVVWIRERHVSPFEAEQSEYVERWAFGPPCLEELHQSEVKLEA